MTEMLSVLIPARNEKLLQKTISSVLAAAVEPIEVIPVLDGYTPDPPLEEDNRVRPIYLEESIGQRAAINLAAKNAKGKYIMKLDAHCAVAPGFDAVLKKDCRYEWTMVPRMYTLDVAKWEPKLNKKTDYMYISHPDHYELKGKDKDQRHRYGFRAMYYGNYAGASSRRPKSDKLIDETMCCMGPGWFMWRDRFWELGGCDEGHGGWGQQGVEVGLKAWLSGGALMVHKGTWFAHWFRGGAVPEGFDRGFPYKISGRDQETARIYSRNLWLENKWEKQTRTIEWLVEKFKPPTWPQNGNGNETMTHEKRMELFRALWGRKRRRRDPSWRGVTIVKFPADMILYQEIIMETQPDYIVEIGTRFGGSALFFQDMLDMCGSGGKVITIDVKNQVAKADDRIQYIIGNSKDSAVVEQVRSMIPGKVMVVIDGNHDRQHVKWDLKNYGTMVTSGQYLVVEDCYEPGGIYGPGEAKEWYLRNHPEFVQTDRCKRYHVGLAMDGWLLRK